MSWSDDLVIVGRRVDVLLAELRQLGASGPHFRIVHRFREPGRDCGPGEEVAAVFLNHRALEIVVPLPLTLRLLFDFLAGYSHLPQSAAQISGAMHADPFYQKHGAYVRTGATLTRKISRSSVKEFIKRIRQALEQTFREANLAVDPRTVVVSERTVGNEVGYRLRATVEWIHVDHPRFDFSGSKPPMKEVRGRVSTRPRFEQSKL
jgi:hypothetical protein